MIRGEPRSTRTCILYPYPTLILSLPGSKPGQIQTLRQFATGSFPGMLMAMAKDPAMIYLLDSQLNTRTRPQENFGREIMELFKDRKSTRLNSSHQCASRMQTSA